MEEESGEALNSSPSGGSCLKMVCKCNPFTFHLPVALGKIQRVVNSPYKRTSKPLVELAKMRHLS